nr:non-ribosomal peptide synthetase [Paenibacillus xylanexedens]
MDVFQRVKERTDNHGILYVNEEGHEHYRSYDELVGEADRMLSGLRGLGLKAGDKVILQFDRQVDFVTVFWGCIIGGIVPIPMTTSKDYREKSNEANALHSVWEMLDNPIILTSGTLERGLMEFSQNYEVNPDYIQAIEKMEQMNGEEAWHISKPEDLALMLFTSGSTGKPKGVQLTHGNIIAREKGTVQLNGFTREDVSLNWMPLEHVGGLVMFHIRDMYTGCQQIQVKIERILTDPQRWMDLISVHRCTVTWAPNFAYGLVTESVESRGGNEAWDLSTMRFILNGGEQITPRTGKRFLEVLRPYGLRSDCMNPAWGMSETCSGVVYSDVFALGTEAGIRHVQKDSLQGRIQEAKPGEEAFTFVEIGRPIPGVSVRIVDHDRNVISEERIGRIQLNGECVTKGYYNNPELNQEMFDEEGWFETGDVGFIRQGRLTITGRSKEEIVINGINISNYEVEAAIERLEGVETSYTAVCALEEKANKESVLIFFVPKEGTDPVQQIQKIKGIVSKGYGIKPKEVIPVSKSQIPKTSIGKIQRKKLVEQFKNRMFAKQLYQIQVLEETGKRIPNWFLQKTWIRKEYPLLKLEESRGTAIIFADDLGLGSTLRENMKDKRDCVYIKMGDQYQFIDSHRFIINPTQPKDYLNVVESLISSKIEIEDIFHFNNYNSNLSVHNEVSLRNYLHYGLYSMVHLVQALKQTYANKGAIGLHVISNNAHIIHSDKKLDYYKGTLTGFLKSLSLETAWLKIKHIDLELNDINQDIDFICNEVRSSDHEQEVAYRNGQRFVSCLSSPNLEVTSDVPIKEGGAYLITGGLGGLSVHFARMLIMEYQAKLIIVGRTELPERSTWSHLDGEERNLALKIKALLELESLSEGVIYLNGDVNDDAFIKELDSFVNSDLGGTLDGIFHMAGIGNLNYHWSAMDRYMVENEDVESYEEMFQAKIYGTLKLQKLLEHNIDSLFVAFSSTTSFFGAASFSGYSAANSYLDNFCAHRRSQGFYNTYCLSWSTWDNVGMSADNPEQMVFSMKFNGYEVIKPLQGIVSLKLALQSGLAHTYVGLNKKNHKIKSFVNTAIQRQLLHIAYKSDKEEITSHEVIESLQVDGIDYKEGSPISVVKVDTMPNEMSDFDVLGLKDESLEAGKHPINGVEEKLFQIWRNILKKQDMARDNNFFEIGGDSLKASKFIFDVKQEFQIEASLRDLFLYPTIQKFASYIQSLDEQQHVSIVPVEPRPYYPASPAQKRMYFLHQLQEKETSYNAPFVYSFTSKVDTDKLEKAFATLIARHDILRTSFEELGDQVLQRIHEHVEPHIQIIHAESDDIENEVSKVVDIFDLSIAPLFRAAIIQFSSEHPSVLVVDMHHIITDGVSMTIFFKELSAAYNDLSLPRLELQYRDYCSWQQRFMESGSYNTQKEYWKEVYSDEVPLLNLHTDYPRPKTKSYKGNSIFFTIDLDLKNRLNQLAVETGSTLYMVLLAAYNILLSKYSGQEDIVVGSPIAGRQHAKLADVMGIFVNTLAIRNYPEAQKTFEAFLQEVKQQSLSAFENQDYPFEELVDELDLPRDLGRNPIFETMFILQNMEFDVLSLGNQELKPHYLKSGTAKFDITLIAVEKDDVIQFILEYCKDLFHEETMERFHAHFKNVLEQIVDRPNAQLMDIELLTEHEKEQMLFRLNETRAKYPENKMIHELFEEQADRVPDCTALVYETQTLTYRQLNEQANSLAHVLRSKGVGPDTIIAIMMDRSLEMVVGILGILKAGAAYLPIDPAYPMDRINTMLSDSQAGQVLVTADVFNRLQQSNEDFEPGNHIVVYEHLEAERQHAGGSNLKSISRPDNLAYIIYTSGSTGKPKGVMIEHRNVVRLLCNDKMMFDFSENDVWTMFHSMCFDFSVWEMYGALLYGGKLVVVPGLIAKHAKDFLDLLKKEKVTVLNQTPTAFYNLAHMELLEPSSDLSIRYVIFGGEALNPILLKDWREKYPSVKLINMYGITETTVHVTYKEITDSDVEENVSQIGSPIPTTTTFVMDKHRKLVPFGVEGELYVGGLGVSRGYLHRPELTSERFVSNPYVHGDRLYRSGDLVKMLPSGEMQYLGRMDHQVKIRGYRIELGEIENLLFQHPSIKEVLVMDRTDKQNQFYLVAYFTADLILGAGNVRSYLKSILPDHMIPSYFMQLDHMPVTANGKIDRKALPEPDMSKQSDAIYEAPRNDTERMLVRIWENVLSVVSSRKETDDDHLAIGISDHFFELGGHSLRATTLVSRIQKEFGIMMPLKAVFEHPTIKEQAEWLRQSDKSTHRAIEHTEKKAYYPVSSAQKRIYVLSMLEGGEQTYNMPWALSFEGPLDKAKMEKSFQMLVKRHEALRTSFDTVEGEPVQVIKDSVHIELEDWTSFADEDEGELLERFVRPFNLNEAPLLRLGWAKVGEKQLLLVDMHHIISDGVSLNVIMEELSSLYNGEQLPEIEIHYKDHSEWQRKWFLSEHINEQRNYWLKSFEGDLPVLNFPTDYPRPSVQSFVGQSLEFTLSPEFTHRLHRLASDTSTTLYMVLLSAYNILLSRYTGQEDIVVGSPIAGRRHINTERMVGMFVNTLAIRNKPEGSKSYKAFLQEVKATAIQAYEHQDYPFEKLVEELNLERDMSRNPLFDTMFVLQNTETARVNLTGVEAQHVVLQNKTAKFDLTLYAIEDQEGVRIVLEYTTSLFKRETIERLYQHYVHVLGEITERPDCKLSEISMLSKEEQKQLLVDFNATRTEYPRDKTIHELFEMQATLHPDQIAVVYENHELTYRDLNECANQLARILRRKGAVKGTVIGIMTNRSIEMIIGILGILKTGGVYLPIDPSYPQERIEYMVENSSARMLLTPSEWFGRVTTGCEEISLDDAASCSESSAETQNLHVGAEASDLAYIIYTSGSTGKPKGVMVEHRGVSRLVCNTNYIQFHEGDRLLQTGSLSFDASTFEIWGVLLNALTMILVDEHVIVDPHLLAEALEEYRISILWLTTPLYHQLAQVNPSAFQNLKQLLVGGDVLTASHVTEVCRHNPELSIINMYGPTENTTFTTFYPIQVNYTGQVIPIGRPIANSSAYILNAQKGLQPVNVIGELFVGGDGLARGYVGLEQLTMERFIEHPFTPGERLYRTGDFARWLPDGNIEFIGRMDEQVKIRGYRIELGEIESQMLKHKRVKEAVVVAREDRGGAKLLFAYYTQTELLEPSELRSYLAGILPSYMIPTHFIGLEKLPLTPSGKLDKRSLPLIAENSKENEHYEGPRSEIENIIANVWQDVLGIQRIGVNDHFFELGGDSIKGIQISSRLNQAGYKLEMKHLFRFPRISELSSYVKVAGYNPEQKEVVGTIINSPIMQWFFEQRFVNQHHWNQAVMLFREEGFEEAILRKVIDRITEHHDALRVVVSKTKGLFDCRNRGVDEGQRYSMNVYHIEDEDEESTRIFVESKADELQASMILDSGPLLKMSLFKTSLGDHLLITIHHLVVDGISWRILFEDIHSAYKQVKEGKTIVLPPKTDSFLTWSAKLEHFAINDMTSEEIDYWRDKQTLDLVPIPTDYQMDSPMESGSLRLRDNSQVTINFTEAETAALLKDANHAYNTEINDLLLTALGMTISKWTGNSETIINLEGHGRENIQEQLDVSRTVGWFTSQYPVVLRNIVGSLADCIKSTKENLRAVPNKGIGYGIWRYLSNEGKKVQHLKPEITFNYLGQFDEDLPNHFMKLSSYNVGTSVSPDNHTLYKLDLNSRVVERKLQLTLDYSTQLYKQETIDYIGNLFKENLNKIIDHCKSRETSEFTPSDMRFKGLSMDELKLLEAEMGDIF